MKKEITIIFVTVFLLIFFIPLPLDLSFGSNPENSSELVFQWYDFTINPSKYIAAVTTQTDSIITQGNVLLPITISIHITITIIITTIISITYILIRKRKQITQV